MDPADSHFRSCLDCRAIVDSQARRAEAAASGADHLLPRFYERLQAHKREGEQEVGRKNTC